MEYAAATKASPTMAGINNSPLPVPIIVSMAFAPKKSTEVKFTKINKAIQKTARMVFRFVEKRFSTNSGIV